MKTPVGLVAVALAAAILLAASLLIVTGTHGEITPPRCGHYLPPRSEAPPSA